ncbi:uncharacterized protein PAE49_016077 [Odontesthes bonariensis]|uniref:uncharacterized protein LOC142398329 n=1 Tax=Odontesthes bonariensis TaxID=219752 RepID=UPI003F58E6E9
MCSVVGCDSWRRSARRFMLPEDPEKRLEWVQFLFDVNGQRLKESSWTDISVCREHFTCDCFINPSAAPGTAQLKCGAVPSVCIKAEPEEPELKEEPTDVAPQCEQLETCPSPTPMKEETSSIRSAPASPGSCYTSDSSTSDYNQMLQKIDNLDIIRKKVALLQEKGQYVVNEKRLLRLFRSKCPLCHSEVKAEKVVQGVLFVLNQQCLQCDYRRQWKNLSDVGIPAAEDVHLTERTEISLETVSTSNEQSRVTGVPQIDQVIGEESDPMQESDGSSGPEDIDSDEDWQPTEEIVLYDQLMSDSEEESSYEEEEPLPKYRQLCTDCGRFFDRRKPHACEHKIKPYSCNICGKRCVNEIYLGIHSRVHDENYEHPCKYCNVTFKTKTDKIAHEQTHLTQKKPYKCPDCSETFAKNGARRIHLRVHRDPEHFQCHFCGIVFPRKIALHRHLFVHTGEKPYKCSVCQRGFKQSNHLKSHMRLHTGEKPYSCQHCDKSFNHNVSLKSHVQRYHTPGSGHERKKQNEREQDSDDAQGNGKKTSADSQPDNAEEEQDAEEEVQLRRKCPPKRRRARTGRPVGRPKRSADEKMQGQGLDTEAANVKGRTSKRMQSSDEESEESFDFTEVEEEEEVTVGAQRSRRRPKSPDSDSDFDPTEIKKRRVCKNDSKGPDGHRGRPRKTQVVEDA